ncbi:MAG: hypothetical protein ACP5JP_08100 [bacterium]
MCNTTVDPGSYKFELSLRIKAAIILGQFAHYIVLTNNDKHNEDRNERFDRSYLDDIINTFEYCLNSNESDLLQAACAEASGNTYSPALVPILQSIVNNPNTSALTVLAGARSLTQIEAFTQSAQTKPMAIKSSGQDPSFYVTNDMVNNAMSYIRRLIPNEY